MRLSAAKKIISNSSSTVSITRNIFVRSAVPLQIGYRKLKEYSSNYYLVIRFVDNHDRKYQEKSLFDFYILSFCVSLSFLFKDYLKYSIIITRFSCFNICVFWYLNNFMIFPVWISGCYFY
jgi:hypothetical protein